MDAQNADYDAISTLMALSKVPEAEIDLALTLLWLCRLEYPHLDLGLYLRRFDILAEQLESRMTGSESATETVHKLADFMAKECGFEGNSDAYYDPRNSYVNDVLDRYLGIPITLSIVYIEVARRAGIKLTGIGFPFHFLLRADDATDTYIDAFHSGRVMDSTDCRDLLSQITDDRLPFDEDFLEPVTSRQIVLRVFRNLKNVYARSAQLEEAITMSDLILKWGPDETIEYRDRGLMRLEKQNITGGISDLEEYLARTPDAPDHALVLAELRHAHRVHRAMN